VQSTVLFIFQMLLCRRHLYPNAPAIIIRSKQARYQYSGHY
jgi:hypothetical protein